MFRRLMFFTAAFIIAGAVVLATIVMAQTEPDSSSATSVQPDDNDSNPVYEPQVVIPDEYRSEAATGSGDGTPIYFTPQDENTSTTILFLYNTGDVTATVDLQTFQIDGSTFISTSVAVPPAHLVRISADTVSTIATSWQDAVLVNFTTSSAYARIKVPTGVKLDGYVAWNGGSTYDPIDQVPTLPLRFSTDPATVFLPAVNGD